MRLERFFETTLNIHRFVKMLRDFTKECVVLVTDISIRKTIRKNATSLDGRLIDDAFIGRAELLLE